jgi:hypothetical protein
MQRPGAPLRELFLPGMLKAREVCTVYITSINNCILYVLKAYTSFKYISFVVVV